jgi:hypothetical protein
LSAAISLDPVAVGIDHETGIVVGPIVGAHSRLAVVASARAKRCGMERIDAVARRRAEAEVQAGFLIGCDRALCDADPERDGLAPIAEGACALAQTRVAKRLERRVIEAFRPRDAD